MYVTPAYHARTDNPDPLKERWSPMSCTLIHTKNSALIDDVTPTIAEAEKLAGWVTEMILGKTVDYFYAAHTHGDHFLAYPVLKKRFSAITFIATAAVKEGIKQQLEPAYFDAVWEAWFPGDSFDKMQLADVVAFPASRTVELDDFPLKIYDVIQGDSSNNSFLHVPQLNPVVGGDLVYGDFYQCLAEANTKQKRANLVRSLEQIEPLEPKIAVPGRTRAGQIPGAYLLRSTKNCFWTFDEELENAG